MKQFLTFVALVVIFSSNAQTNSFRNIFGGGGTTLIECGEAEGDLGLFSYEKAAQYERERSFPPRAPRGGGSINLPFFDDFSTYSLPTSDPDIPVELQRWVDDHAFINCTFPLAPPTVGVATLDGLDRTGYPYSFVTDAQGPADTLTSIPINLSGFSAASNVYLHFMYQGGGIGNAPEPQDSLILEFLAPLGGENPWIQVWAVPGSSMQEFQQVFVHVDNPIFLLDNFQFRFRNKATLTGNLDHWHIDYVLMNNNIIPESFDFFEVAFMFCPNSLLQDYTAMPWTHFVSNPPQFMRTTHQTTQQNLSSSQADNVTSGFKVEYEGTVWNYQNGFSQIVVAPNEVFTTNYAINSNPNNFAFDPNVNDSCAAFNVSFYQDNIGILADEKIGVPNNDSIVFVQRFENYYAYDDGSAERTYSVNTAGGRIAMKYTLATTDTLLGLFIHFVPFQVDNSTQTFLLRAWSDNNGVPGEEIGENFQFQNPSYYQNGYNVFGYYEYDEPREVSGVVYVGFVQDSPVEMHVGNDKNTNANPSRLFYQLGLGAAWQQSQITGSVMIRPVFKSGKTGVWNSVTEIETASNTEFNIYPIPTSSVLTVSPYRADGLFYRASVFNTQGQLVVESDLSTGDLQLEVNHLADDLYFVICQNKNGDIIHRQKVIKQSNR